MTVYQFRITMMFLGLIVAFTAGVNHSVSGMFVQGIVGLGLMVFGGKRFVRGN